MSIDVAWQPYLNELLSIVVMKETFEVRFITMALIVTSQLECQHSTTEIVWFKWFFIVFLVKEKFLEFLVKLVKVVKVDFAAVINAAVDTAIAIIGVTAAVAATATATYVNTATKSFIDAQSGAFDDFRHVVVVFVVIV